MERIHNRSYLKPHRKQLRNNATAAESVLWLALKSRQLDGRKFRRQHSVGNYILDFYCVSESLGIELDGQGHQDSVQSDYDYARSQYLLSLNIKVIRFENKLVHQNLEDVLSSIVSEFGWSNK